MTRSIHCALALLEEGWRRDVRLDFDNVGTIVAIASEVDSSSTDHLSGVVLPGMPNLHSHGFQRLMAGLSGSRQGDDSFWTWRRTMYDLANRVTPDQLEHCMAGVCVEMLKGGYTSLAEFHYLHHAGDGTRYDQPAELSLRVLNGASLAGMAITLLPVLYCRSGFGASGPLDSQRGFANSLAGFSGIVEECRDRVQRHQRVGLALHSLRAVNQGEMDGVLELRRTAEPVHIHVAEQPGEVSAAVEHLGARPLAWILDHFDVDEGWCLVHATHLSEDEIERGAASGAVAGLCPTTEADLGDGIFDGAGWQAGGGRFGIGSDSNLRLEVAEELRMLEFSQRLQTGARNVLATPRHSVGRWIYENAARGGAQALGQKVGKLAPGHRADLVELDRLHPMLEGLDGDSLLDSYLFAGGREMIASVWVGGERLVERNVHRHEERIGGNFRRVLNQLRQ